MEILQDGHEYLKQKMEEVPVEELSLELIKGYANEMYELMLENDGYGLAANQVGLPYRFFIMKDGDGYFETFINPKIETATGKRVSEEGCLSFKNPVKTYKIKRKEAVTVSYNTLGGNRVERFFTGFPATCVQHEIDHLNGRTMRDTYNEQANKRNRFFKRKFN